LSFATAVAPSHAIAGDLKSGAQVIGNPYNADVFRPMSGVKRELDLVFVGRLIHDKGAHLILKALALLKSRGRQYRLTLVGSGPEEVELRRLIDELELANLVTFAGPLTGVRLASALSAHQVLVVPSLWQEPFGIVALEGCACGCVPIGSEGGGLPEAIGPSGVTFPNGDVNALAERIDLLLSSPALRADFQAASDAHLARHKPPAVADAYMRVFRLAMLKTAPTR
jgi:glycosyltransferase involved in cell wall biosynthesis